MKIRILIGTRVSANEKGTDSRYLSVNDELESGAPWEDDLFSRLVDAGLAEEADKSVTAIETKKSTRRRK